MRRFSLLVAIAAVLHASACGQDAAPMTADTVLTKLHENAVAYEARLPSLACREHIVSQFLRGGKVARAITVDDVVRAVRSPGARHGMEEERRPVDAAGEPKEHGTMPSLPLLISDSLYGGQHFYADLGKNRACGSWDLDTTGSKLRLNYHRRDFEVGEAGCTVANDGMEGFSLVDRATGQMVFDRHTLSLDAARRQGRASLAELTFAPVLLGEETFWLPQRVYAEVGPTLRFTATYSGCKRYLGSARVLGVVPEGEQP